MLFPDWPHGQEILINRNGWETDTYTVTQGSFLIGLYHGAKSVNPSGVVIDGKEIFGRTSDGGAYTLYPCFYCTKGTVLKNTSNSHAAIFKVIPLVKSGGGVRVSSYHIVLHKRKPKKETLCH